MNYLNQTIINDKLHFFFIRIIPLLKLILLLRLRFQRAKNECIDSSYIFTISSSELQ